MIDREKIDVLVKRLVEVANSGQGDEGFRRAMRGFSLTREEAAALSEGMRNTRLQLDADKSSK